jgi:endoglucanase
MDFSLRYNHVGYAPAVSKEFLVAGDSSVAVPARFQLVSVRGETVFSGAMGEKGTCSYTGEFLWQGDFSAFSTLGHFRIVVLDGAGTPLAQSREFEIAGRLTGEQLTLTLESFYFQRSGVELPADRARKWARPAAHLDNSLEFHPSMNRAGTWDAHGGWYDAGDYGKYIVNGGVSVGTLLLAAELSEVGRGPVVHPVSFRTNLLEEVRFELEFFLRMQDTDGGVFFKVSPIRWDGFVSPTQSDLNQKRQILGKSTTSTLNFAGVMAHAHRVYRNIYPAFAEKCLGAAIRAYSWAIKNPDVTYPHNTEGSGGYGDERYDDEFFWTRAMLFREMQSGAALFLQEQLGSVQELRSLLEQDMEKCPPQPGLSWRDTDNLGWIALALQNGDLPLRDRARTALVAAADRIVQICEKDAYGISVDKFVWGSNGVIANHGLTLMLANLWKPDTRYVKSARGMLDFIYGKNPVNTCFVTGAAWSSPKFPHHRICHSDGVEDPIPGLVVGGINADRQDMRRFPHYPGPQPGFSYTDERCSFASNETAINWNAPLVALLSLMQ